jgi:hypothetical protein
MAKRSKPGHKCKGKFYWRGVAMAQGRERKVSAATLVNQCVRSCRGAGREACEDAVKSGLKGRRKARKSGVPWKRKLSRSKPAVAARKGFKKASKSCARTSKTRRGFLSCMKGKARKEIAAAM